MLHLIPAPLHRLLYRIADRVRKRWWRVFKTRRRSANVVAFDDEGRVLLVRHSYGRPVWTLPGGGIGWQEVPAVGMAREFREELACGLTDLTLVEHRVHVIDGSPDDLYLFAARLDGVPRPDMREIVALDYFDPANLPPAAMRLTPGWIAKAVAVMESGGTPSE